MSAAVRDYPCPTVPQRRFPRRFAGPRASATSASGWLKPANTDLDALQPAGFTPIPSAISDGTTDFSAEARAALARLNAYMPGARLQFAAEPGLSVRVSQRAMAQLLDLILGAAAEAAPSGRILLGAMAEVHSIRIVVLDDSVASGRDQAVHQAAGLAARHGGLLEMESTAGAGTIAVLRLPAA